MGIWKDKEKQEIKIPSRESVYRLIRRKEFVGVPLWVEIWWRREEEERRQRTKEPA